jgi:hypothetical protein
MNIVNDVTCKHDFFIIRYYGLLDWCSSNLFQKSKLMEGARLYIYFNTPSHV